MPSKFTPIRLVVGAWCLLTLVMLNVYNGVLISYVTESGRPQPLINSFYDVPHDSNILLVIDKGLATDIVISVRFSCLKKPNGATRFLNFEFENFIVGTARIVQGNEGQVGSTSQFEMSLHSAMCRSSKIFAGSTRVSKCKRQNPTLYFLKIVCESTYI